MDLHSRSSIGWTEEHTQWEDMCVRRSALAFFAELYADTALASSVDFLDQAGLDQLMREKSRYAVFGADNIPAHMPARHWWWWLPGAPPA